MPKHGWNSFENYLSVHEKTLSVYSNRFIFFKQYTLNKITEQYYELVLDKTRIITNSGNEISIEIRKEIEGDGGFARPRAKTISYRYCASKPNPDGRCIIRYDSPHDDALEPGAAQHHKFHHKHDFRDGSKGIVLYQNDDWPHVSDFLFEVVTYL